HPLLVRHPRHVSLTLIRTPVPRYRNSSHARQHARHRLQARQLAQVRRRRLRRRGAHEAHAAFVASDPHVVTTLARRRLPCQRREQRDRQCQNEREENKLFHCALLLPILCACHPPP